METNSQRNLKTNRAPRVQIEYDVEVNGQTRQVELPFVMGVLSDLSGDNTGDLPIIAEREFTEINQANIDQRMREISPQLQLKLCSICGCRSFVAHAVAMFFSVNLFEFQLAMHCLRFAVVKNFFQTAATRHEAWENQDQCRLGNP